MNGNIGNSRNVSENKGNVYDNNRQYGKIAGNKRIYKKYVSEAGGKLRKCE